MASPELLEFLKGWERLKLHSSLDTVASRVGLKIYDIGYGHVIHESQHPMTITREEAEKILEDDVQSVEERLRPLITVPTLPHEWDAIVSFCYNVGVGKEESGFAGSTMRDLLNSGDYEGAAKQFPRWNKSGGKIVYGLIKRRAAEQEMFLYGAYDGRP